MLTPADKRRLTATYAELLLTVTDVLRLRDPVGLIEAGAPSDEYGPEARRIVARSREMHSEDAVRQIVTEEFERQFGLATYLDEQALQLAALDIWRNHDQAAD